MPPPMNLPWVFRDEHYPHVAIHLAPMSDRWGETVWNGADIHIRLALDLSEIQHRCVLAHELMHVKAGRPCSSLCPDNEARVVEDTATWLLPDLAEVGEALSECDLDEAATRLLVTRKVLLDRVHYLSDAEIAELASHMRPSQPAGLTAAHPTDHVATNPTRRRYPARRPSHRCRTEPSRSVQP